MAQSIDEGTLSAANPWGDKALFSSSKRKSAKWASGSDTVFGRESSARREDDEEALTWIALEKLPTYDRVRTSMLEQVKGSRIHRELVDMSTFGREQREELVGRVFPAKAEIDNFNFIQKYRERLDRVGLRRPTVEVRYENLNIEANCYLGDRSLPTLYNNALNYMEMLLSSIGIPVAQKEKVPILRNVSGIIKPGRMTLLLGPPGSGKTSLLLALAGALDRNLKVDGKVTYNGHTLDEFIPQKSAAYISQNDLHQGELTVRETLDFSAKCQGVGERFHILQELVKREKEQGIRPEPDIDLFLKGAAQPELSSDFVTDYITKILGLDICADVPVGDPMHRGISGGQKKRVTTGKILSRKIAEFHRKLVSIN